MAVFMRLVVTIVVFLCLFNQVIAQNDVGNPSSSPLFDAAEAGDIKRLQELVSQGFDINERNAQGLTAAHQATYRRHHEALGEIIRLGANLNAQDNDGWTPLMTAASTGDTVITQILLDGNANPLIHSNDNYLAHSYADFSNYPNLSRQLANAALVRAILSTDYFTMFLVIEDGADVNVQTLQGATALIVAAHEGQTDVVRRLLTVPGIHPDFQEADGWTALMFAANSGNMEIVHMLLDFGVDLSIQTVQGLTAVDVARQFEQHDIVHVLEERARQIAAYQAQIEAEQRQNSQQDSQPKQAEAPVQAEAAAPAPKKLGLFGW